MNLKDVLVVILAAIVTGALLWTLCGKAAWFIGHDDGLWAGRRWEHDVYEIGDLGKRWNKRK